MQHPGKGEKKVCIVSPGLMTKGAAGKNVKNHLQNAWADCLENWYVAFGG